MLYAAAWAQTSRAARAARPGPTPAPVEGPPSPPLRQQERSEHPWAASYAAGAVTMLGLVAARPPARSSYVPEGLMKLERKHGWLLVGIALWNFVVWGTFIKNLAASHASGEDRPVATTSRTRS